MPAASPPVFSVAVEGDLDEAVITRLASEVGATVGPVYGKRGKEALKARLRGYNSAARYSPWLVLLDLNQEEPCAPPFRQRLLADRAPQMCLRIAVRAVEAWLLGDRERLSRRLAIPVTRLETPSDPEALDDPKQFLVQAAVHSRSRLVRRDLIPSPGSGRKVGPGYTSRLIEFVIDRQRGWRPDVAAGVCDSLERAIRRLRELVS